MFRRTALAATALLALGGSLTQVSAAEDRPVPVAAAPAGADLPRFAPSQPDAFEAGFAPFEGVPDVAVPDHAVDMDTIEPAEESPAETIGSGVASYYAAQFDGRPTASGERFDNDDLTAAHRTLPFGSRVRVTNPRTGRSVVVRINDRGPFHGGRMIDLSRAAAEQVGIVAAGHGTVQLALLRS